MQESSLHFFLFNRITLQKKQPKPKQTNTPPEQADVSPKVWLYRVRCTGEKKSLMFMAEMLCVKGRTTFCSQSKSPHSSVRAQSGP